MSINRWLGKEDVVNIHNGILLGHKKWNLNICDNTDGSTCYYAKWNKSGRERQIPYDFTYMWNLKNKINEQTKQKQTHTYWEQTECCQMRGGFGGMCEKDIEIKEYRLVVPKRSWDVSTTQRM